ncbi:hypothetical protein H6F78_12960 [Coleofasciculus sp. FACHB-64]|uniref:hypothetical protein n=1 Tax=Cyanophyceae TaxID=3028117 RepID=UPI00168384D1|nr:MULTISPECIES: hypothetical protein [unclassified Coleofasciculus]MBD1840212.1 hypothetical protein [Coleofasciculus sp. FACHB-501]MBD2046492.1 hypothetical protein [Coleofasciculus sp. FACHB-64]
MSFFKTLARISYSLSVGVMAMLSGAVITILLLLVFFEINSCSKWSLLNPSNGCRSSYWKVLQDFVQFFVTTREGLTILAILIIPRIITFCVRTWKLLNKKKLRSAKGRRLQVKLLNKIAEDVAVYWLKIIFKISLWVLILSGVFLLFPLLVYVTNDLSQSISYLKSLPYGATRELLINILFSCIITYLCIKVSKHFGISLLED